MTFSLERRLVEYTSYRIRNPEHPNLQLTFRLHNQSPLGLFLVHQSFQPLLNRADETENENEQRHDSPADRQE